jgi:hypothetical protein
MFSTRLQKEKRIDPIFITDYPEDGKNICLQNVSVYETTRRVNPKLRKFHRNTESEKLTRKSSDPHQPRRRIRKTRTIIGIKNRSNVHQRRRKWMRRKTRRRRRKT